jgi:restriction endonuclease S subunit
MDTKTFLENFGTIADAPGGVVQLRDMVLSLATSGSLSTTLESDESAETLLNEILDLREGLILSGTIRRPRPIGADPTSEPTGSIPHGWVWAPLAVLSPFDLVDGDWVESKDQDPGGEIRLVQLADVGIGEFKNKSDRFLNVETADRLGVTLLTAGDVLIARLPNPLGRACCFPGLETPAATVVDVAIVRMSLGGIDSRFLVHCLNSPLIRERISGLATGTTRARVSTGNLRKLLVPIPPLAEQKRIVARVDELMALCDELEEKQQRKATVTTKLRGSAFNALRQAETPDDLAAAWERISTNWSHLTNQPDSIPELRKTILDLAYSEKLMLNYPDGTSGEWDATTLGEVAEIRTGKLDANASSPNGQYPFFTCARLPLRIESYTYDFECALIGGNGNFDVHYANGKFDAYQRTYIIKPKAAEETSAKFLYWFMQGYSEELRKQSIGGVIQYLKIGFLKDAPLRLPSLRVQELVVAKIEFMLAMCDQLEKQIQYQQDLGSRLAIASTRLAD